MTETVTTDVKNSDIKGKNVSIATNDEIVNVAKGGAGGLGIGIGVGAGVGVTVETVNNKVATDIESSTLTAEENIDVKTQENRDISGTTMGVGVGIAGVGVNVVTLNVNSDISDVTGKDSEALNDGKLSVHMDRANSAGDNIAKDAVGLSSDTKNKLQEQQNNTKASLTTDRKTAAGVTTNVSGATLTAGNDLSINSAEYNDFQINNGAIGAGGTGVGVADNVIHVNHATNLNLAAADLSAKTINVKALQGATGNKHDGNGIDVSAVSAAGGGLAVGVGYTGITTKGSTNLNIAGSKFNATDSINLGAEDAAKSYSRIIGVAAGGIAPTVAYALADNNSSANVNVQSGAVTQMNAQSGKININAAKNNTVRTATEGAAGGGVSVVVNTTKSIDNGAASVKVAGSGHQFTAGDVTLSAQDAPITLTNAGSTGVISLVGVNVMSALADATANANVTVDDGNTFNADNVTFSGITGKNGQLMADVDGRSVNVSAVAVSPDTAKAKTDTKVNVNIGKENYKTATTKDSDGNTITEYKTKLNIIGESNDSRKAKMYGFSLGLALSTGSSSAETEGKNTINVSAKGGDVNSLTLTGNGTDAAQLYSSANGGGAMKFGTGADSTNNTDNDAYDSAR